MKLERAWGIYIVGKGLAWPRNLQPQKGVGGGRKELAYLPPLTPRAEQYLGPHPSSAALRLAHQEHLTHLEIAVRGV